MYKFISAVALGLLALVRANVLTEESFECKNEGRFEDPSDCGYYFECIPNGFVSLKAYRRSCLGNAFNPLTNSCTDPSKIKGCKVRESRKYSAHTRFSALCSSNPNTKYLCADCGTSVMCSEGKAYPIKCEDDLRCNTNITKFEGAICYPEYTDKCSCRKAKTYFQDPYYNGTFFFCNEVDSIPTFYHCQSNMYFNERTKSCTNEDGLPACREWGVFPYPDTCNKYYTCTFALEGWIQTRLQCPHNELLNVETGNCENPCNRTSNEFKCEEEGRFENPKDCNQFYECIKNATGGMREIKRSCPPSYHWNKTTHLCVKSENSDCKPETEGPFKNCQKDYDAICNNNNAGNQMMNNNSNQADLIKSELPNIPLIQIKS